MIVMMGLAGLVISGIYLLITPNQYEAVANIAMARVPADSVYCRLLVRSSRVSRKKLFANKLTNRNSSADRPRADHR